MGILVLHNSTGKPGRKDTVRTPKPEDLPFMKNASVTSDGRVQKEVLFYLRRMKGLLFSTGFCARGGGRKRYFFYGCFARLYVLNSSF